MDREELLKKINNLLEENPFTDEEVSLWRSKLSGMRENELQQLLRLLEERVKILTNANQLFINIAEELADRQKKSEGMVPKGIDISDLPFEDLLKIVKGNLAVLLKDINFDLIRQLDEYFFFLKIENEEVVTKFDQLVDAISLNEEKLFEEDKDVGNISVSQWLGYYKNFNDSFERKSINRMSFASSDKNTKKLDQSQKEILVKLLKLYDYLVNPTEVLLESSDVSQGANKIRTISGPPKTQEEKRIDSLAAKRGEVGEKSLAGLAVKEEIDNTKRIEDLKIMANRYKDNSLQKRAIEQEIKKLEGK